MVIEKRTCPKCNEPAYSSKFEEGWKCPSCGSEVKEGGREVGREIKFRGKRVDSGEWAYWNEYGECTEQFICKTGAYGYIAKRDIIPKTVGQYTGLHDKNGKEIYEGDVLKVIDPNNEENVRCVVEWDEYGGCFSYEPDGGYGDFDVSTIGWSMGLGFKFEVIGNIHENPELLEVTP